MFGIGMPEMLLILAIALIVIGPKKLPDLAKSLGRALGEFKKATSELKDSLQIDSELKDVKTTFDEINQDLKDRRPASPKQAEPDAANDMQTEPVAESDAVQPESDPLDAVKAAFDRRDDSPESDAAIANDTHQPSAEASDSEADASKA
jgi:TatA/E family protein of Tat protein translocase